MTKRMMPSQTDFWKQQFRMICGRKSPDDKGPPKARVYNVRGEMVKQFDTEKAARKWIEKQPQGAGAEQ